MKQLDKLMPNLISFIPGISRVLSNVTPILLLFVFSKFITISELGELNYFISLITVIGIVTDFGLPEAVQRFLPLQTESKNQRYLLKVIVIEVVVTLIAAGILAIADYFANGAISISNTGMIAAIIIASASNTIILSFNGLRKDFLTSIYFLASSLLFLAGTFLLYFGLNYSAVDAFLWSRLLSWLIVGIVATVHLWRLGEFTENTALPSGFINFALSSCVVMICHALYNQSDSLLVNFSQGSAINGVYKSAVFLGGLPFVLNTVLNTKLLPQFSHLYSHNNLSVVRKQVATYIRMILLLGVGMVAGAILLGEFALKVIYNQTVATEGHGLLLMTVIATSIYLIGSPISAALLAFGDAAFLRNISLIQTTIFILAAVIVLPILGVGILPILYILINSIIILAMLNHWQRISKVI